MYAPEGTLFSGILAEFVIVISKNEGLVRKVIHSNPEKTHLLKK